MTDSVLRDQIVNLLQKGNAHMPFAEAVDDFPQDKINLKPPNLSYSFWHLVEHLRLTQLDILEFITNPNYKEMEWPKDYWPAPDATATWDQWLKSIDQFNQDLNSLIKIAQHPKVDLTATLPYAKGPYKDYTYLREFLVVADHNAYHIGELGILRQVTNTWPLNHQ
jgi:hypothetical protein